MKHLLSIIAALFLLLNITNAQTESYNTRTINGKPYVIYQIKTGDTWASIAEKFGITERSLIDGNKQTNGTLKNVITLKVPMENSTKNITSNTAAKEAPVEVNSLPKIGENTNINNPKTNDIKILGKELRTEVKGANSLAVYKIGFGDNIYNIAKYYNCKVDDIKNLNNLISSSLTPGKIIKIPIKNSPLELPNVVNSSVVTTLQSELETSAIISDTPTNIKPMVQQVTIEKEPTKTEIVTEPKIKVAVPTEKSNQTNGNYITRTIKGKDYIIYGIKAGDTWNSIAAKFGVSENRLKAENTQTYGNLKGAYTLKIPIDKNNNTPVNSEIKTETAVVNSDINKLEQEDSTIKNENDIPKINEVKAANNIDELKTEQEESTIQLKPNETIIGEYLVIKKIGKLYIKHLVISGEDLTRISKECYTTNSKIIAANNLSKTKLYTGQLLLIPTNKQILFKLTGLNYDEIEKKKNEAIIAENNKITNDVAKDTDTDTDADTDSDDKTDTVIQTNATKTINTVAVKKYNWGDPIITKPTILDSNAKQTTIDLSKEINTNDIHANASKGETKDSYTHNVLKGETIASIAKKYKISTSDIANWNNLYQNRIRVGQDLIVNLERSKKPFVLINSISPESNKQIKNLDKSKNVRFVEEKGLCYLSNEKFVGVAHRNVPVGTLLLLTSTENYKKIYVRVTSILENSNVDVILQVDNNIAKQLAFNSTLTNVLLTYSLVE